MYTRQDKIQAIKNAWHFVEDVYGVGELRVELYGGAYIRLCNDNPQQFLFIYHSLTEASRAYTHIESWLNDVSMEEMDAIVSWKMKGSQEEHKPSLKRCLQNEECSNKKRKVYLSHDTPYKFSV